MSTSDSEAYGGELSDCMHGQHLNNIQNVGGACMRHKVLERLERDGLKVNWENPKFKKKKMKFLENVISAEGMTVDP